MDREAFKAQLVESGLSAEQAEEILESIDKFKEVLVAEQATKIEEGIQEVRLDLEKKRLEELDVQKTEAETKLAEEVKVFESRLAERVKTLVESRLDAHGDQIVAILERNEAKKGSEILEEISEYVVQAKLEIQETTADPKEVIELKKVVEGLKTEVTDLSEQVNTEKARANIAEGDLGELRVAIDQEVSVSIEEDIKVDDAGNPIVTEETNTTPAEETHEDSQNVIEEDDSSSNEPEMTDGMKRMRELAGIGVEEKK